MPRPYRYRLAPSASSSACSVSHFELACDFRELAGRYPEFERAWTELTGGRRRRDNPRPKSKEDASCASTGRDGCDEGAATSSTPASKALSGRASHAFNAALSRSLLRRHFRLDMPSLPSGRLCPPIPNRANYVCWIRELLASSRRDLCRSRQCGNEGRGRRRRGMDIGTGVSAIYPLLLSTELFAKSEELSATREAAEGPGAEGTACTADSRPWKFLATDIDPLAVQSARANVEANHLEDRIFVMKVEEDATTASDRRESQKGPLHAAMEEAKKLPAFQDADGASPKFDFVMTNPPFYATTKEATEPRAGDKRSRTDMSSNEGVYAPAPNDARVGGDDTDEHMRENQSDGGDVGFVAALMNDSQTFRHDVTWYTSLVAKRSSLDILLRKLQTLDGVRGNRGQIRTVEFRQGNVEGGASDERREKRGSPRVRWGIGWTYERAVGRCSACRVTGGLQSFEVWVTVNDAAKCCEDGVSDRDSSACDEVISRLVEYFEKMRDCPLKCSQERREKKDRAVDAERCVTAVEERFFNRNPSRPPALDHAEDNDNLPYEGHFVIDAFVKSSGRCNDSGQVGVRVDLEMYSHTKRGTAIINKVRGPMPGEIGRTNRRWRRLLKRQGAAG